MYPATFVDSSPPVDRPYEAHYQINRCGGCGLMYSSPIPDAAVTATLYTEASHANVETGEEANVRRTFEGYYRMARPFVRERRRFLDVGCDVGILLGIVAADGFTELVGLEPNPVAAARAATVPRSRILPAFYEEAQFDAGSFDLVSLVHVIDHLTDVETVLAKVLHDLRPGGLVLAVVHNVECLLARVLGQRFPPFNLYHHYFFSKDTLRRLFARHGFEVVAVASTYNVYSLGFLARKFPVGGPALGERFARLARAMKIARIPVSLPLGNIAIVARRPAGNGARS
jgi:SAM-dependent methyltransferase